MQKTDDGFQKEKPSFDLGGHSFFLDEKYEILSIKRCGTSSIICSARDKEKKTKVCIKKVKIKFASFLFLLNL